MAIHPYLFFHGNCADAFARYQEIFGGELVLIKAADMPEAERPPAGADDLIMHGALKLGDELLMASDDPTDGAGPIQGMMVNYSVSDSGEAKRIFDALAETKSPQNVIALFERPRFDLQSLFARESSIVSGLIVLSKEYGNRRSPVPVFACPFTYVATPKLPVLTLSVGFWVNISDQKSLHPSPMPPD